MPVKIALSQDDGGKVILLIVSSALGSPNGDGFGVLYLIEVGKVSIRCRITINLFVFGFIVLFIWLL